MPASGSSHTSTAGPTAPCVLLNPPLLCFFCYLFPNIGGVCAEEYIALKDSFNEGKGKSIERKKIAKETEILYKQVGHKHTHTQMGLYSVQALPTLNLLSNTHPKKFSGDEMPIFVDGI